MSSTANSIKFKDEFCGSTMTDFKYLFERSIYYEAFAKVQQKIKQNLFNNFKKFAITADMKDAIDNFQNDPAHVEKKLKIFMEKLLFVTSLDGSDLSHRISLEILRLINDSSKFSDAILMFKKSIEDWIYDKNLNIQLTAYYKFKLNETTFLQMFQPICDETFFQKCLFKFSEFPEELQNFLKLDTSFSVLIYAMSKGETFWGSIRLHNLNNLIIFCKFIDRDDFKRIQSFIKYANDKFCLVVEFTGTCVVELNKFIEDFKKNSKAKLVIVCEDEVSHKLMGYDLKTVESKILCSQLSNDSLIKLK